MNNKYCFIFLSTMALGLARAEIRASFIEEMRSAQIKLDSKTDTSNKSAKEPESSRFSEFGKLVDESYEILEKEKTKLLALEAADKSLQSRLDSWVLVAALSLHLDPSDSVAELMSELLKKHPAAFKAAHEKLEKSLKDETSEAIRTQRRVEKGGNGG